MKYYLKYPFYVGFNDNELRIQTSVKFMTLEKFVRTKANIDPNVLVLKSKIPNMKLLHSTIIVLTVRH